MTAWSRSIDLAQRLIRSLPDRPRLLFAEPPDEAALVWLAAAIGRAQRWIVADPDPAHVDLVFDRLADWARKHKLTTTWPTRALLIHAPGGAWRIEGVVRDPADLMEPEFVDAVIVDRAGAGAAVWHAYRDPQDRPPLLACLCSTGRTTWLPRRPADVLIAPPRHSARPELIVTALRDSACTVAAAVTDRRITSTDLAALRALVENAAATADAAHPSRRGVIAAWRTARLRQTLSARLAVRLGYRDILAFPPHG